MFKTFATSATLFKTQFAYKMFLAVTALLVAIFSPFRASGDADVSVDCQQPPPVQKFAAAFYTAMIVGSDPNVVDHLKTSGGQAGFDVHNEVKNVLEEHQQCNAEEVAFVAGRAVAIDKIVTLPSYFNKAAYSIASALYKFGILDCDSAIPLALEWFGYVQDEMKGRDKEVFDSYAHGLIYGLAKLYLNHGLKLSDVSQESANLFYQSYAEDKKKCPFTNDSSGEDNKLRNGDVDTPAVE